MRIGYILAVAVVSVLAAGGGAGGDLSAASTRPATRPASTKPAKSETYTFKRVYRAGQKLRLTQFVRFRAWTGQFRRDDPLVDMYRVQRYAVKVTALGDGVKTSVRLREELQRGLPRDGRFHKSYAGLTESYIAHSKRDKVQIPFEAELNAAGRIVKFRGAGDILSIQDTSYRRHPAIVRRLARENDSIRQTVEEPCLYLPPGPVRLGASWQVNRTLKELRDLPIYYVRLDDIDEVTECRLTGVDATPVGRIATISISGRLAGPTDGSVKALTLKKTGLVRYNLDAGRLVSHEIRLEGQLTRSSGRRAMRVDVMVRTSLGAASGDRRPAKAPKIPSLACGGRVTFVYRRGTGVHQTHGGRIWTMPPKGPQSPINRKNLERLKYPTPLRDPRKLADGRIMRDFRPGWRDSAGRVWAVNRGDNSIVTWTEKGKVYHRQYGGYYGTGPLRQFLPGRTGKNFFVDSKGNVFIPGTHELHVYDGKKWTRLKYPWAGEPLRLSQYQYTLFRQMGDVVYIARNFGPSRCDAHSSILAYQEGQIRDIGWVSCQQLSFLASHDGKLLAGTPMGLWSIEEQQATSLEDPEAARRLISRVGDKSSKVSDAAIDALIKMGPAARKLVRQAVAKCQDEQQWVALRYVLSKLATGGSSIIRPAKLRGYASLDKLFESRTGKQYYRPWQEGQGHPEPFLLCTDGEAEVKKIPLPFPPGRLRFEHETPDGKIFGISSRSVFALDVKSGKIQELFLLGRFANEPSLRIAAVKDGRFCLRVRTCRDQEGDLYFWYDPSAKCVSRLIQAREIASGLFRETNYEPDWAVSPGPDGRRLWMVQAVDEARYRLAYAEEGKVTHLPGTMPGGRGAVLPLHGKAAMFLPNSRWYVYLHTGEEIHRDLTVKGLIGGRYKDMVSLVPAGRIYMCRRATWPMFFLVRLGPHFWVYESWMQRMGSGERTVRFTGVCDERGSRKVEMSRIVGVDAETNRLLAYTGDYRALAWFGADGKGEEKIRRDYAFAWVTPDMTNRPYFAGNWVLTEENIDSAAERIRKNKGELDWKDFRSYRLWTPDGWKVWKGVIWDGSPYRDSAGSVWQLRSREVQILLPDGRKQMILLSEALEPRHCEFVEEKPGAVWLATDQAFIRLVAQRGKSGKLTGYRIDRRFSFRNFAYAIRGPWILGGEDFYFAHSGKLYHTKIRQLLASGRGTGTDRR